MPFAFVLRKLLTCHLKDFATGEWEAAHILIRSYRSSCHSDPSLPDPLGEHSSHKTTCRLLVLFLKVWGDALLFL